MVDTYECLNERFPIIDVVIQHLSCADTEKALLKELFVTIYRVGYGDGQADRKPIVGQSGRLKKSPT
jgi:hypothetical protein